MPNISVIAVLIFGVDAIVTAMAAARSPPGSALFHILKRKHPEGRTTSSLLSTATAADARSMVDAASQGNSGPMAVTLPKLGDWRVPSRSTDHSGVYLGTANFIFGNYQVLSLDLMNYTN